MRGRGEESVTAGAPITVRAAEAVLPMPPSVEVTWVVVSVNVPVAVATTVADTVQVPGASCPPLTPMLSVPVSAVSVPPQVFSAAGWAAMTIPIGSVSVNERPVSVKVGLGLVIVNVSVDVPVNGIDEGENDSLIVAALATAGSTIRPAQTSTPMRSPLRHLTGGTVAPGRL